MRHIRQILVSSALFTAVAAAQTAPPIALTTSPAIRDAWALALVTQASTALGGAGQFRDVTLAATCNWMGKSGRENGEATFTATGVWGAAFDLGAGRRREAYTAAHANASAATAQWAGADQAVHAMSNANAWVPGAWFYPALGVLAQLSRPTVAIAYIGMESRHGVAVDHLRYHQEVRGTPAARAHVAAASAVDLYLDAETHLPAAIEFHVFPDPPARQPLAVEADYGDYRPIPGGTGQMPFHVVRKILGNVEIEANITAVQTNTGITGSALVLH